MKYQLRRFLAIVLACLLAGGVLSTGLSAAAADDFFPLPIPARQTAFPLRRPAVGSNQVAVGGNSMDCFSALMKQGGTVVTAGRNFANDDPQPDPAHTWSDIVRISANDHSLLGLTADGRVVSNIANSNGYGTTAGLADIVKIEGGWGDWIALKSDGTVAIANSDYILDETQRAAVESWTGIVDISAGGWRSEIIAGLKADGSVVCAMHPEPAIANEPWIDWPAHLPNIAQWRDIAAIEASRFALFGIKADGSAVVESWAPGEDDYAKFRSLTGVVEIASSVDGDGSVIALLADGSVVASNTMYADGNIYMDGNEYGVPFSQWDHVISVGVNGGNFIGLRADGAILRNGRDLRSGWANPGYWNGPVQKALYFAGTVIGLKENGVFTLTGSDHGGLGLCLPPLRGVEDIIQVGDELFIRQNGNAILRCAWDHGAARYVLTAYTGLSWDALEASQILPAWDENLAITILADGSAVGTGRNYNGEINFYDWSLTPIPRPRGFSDAATGVAVDSPDGAFPPGTEMVVTELGPGNFTAGPGGSAHAVFDIRFYKDGALIQPASPVTVRIPFGDVNPNESANWKVYHVIRGEGGEIVGKADMDARAAQYGGVWYWEFVAGHFSVYAVVEESDDDGFPPAPARPVLNGDRNVTLAYRGSKQLSVTGEALEWSSSGKCVAVDQSGKITSAKEFVKTGSAVVRAGNSAGYVEFNVKVRPTFWQWLQIIFLFGWIWM